MQCIRQETIDAQRWWPMVLGTGYRGTIEQLDAAQRERVRNHCFEYVRTNGVESVEANVLYGLATKSET